MGRVFLERRHVLFSRKGCSRVVVRTRLTKLAGARNFSRQILTTVWADQAWLGFSSYFFTCLRCRRRAPRSSIEPRVGFHGVFQLGRPFPLEIELSNTGRPAEGTLEVRVWKGGATKGGAPYPVKYHRDIFLAAQSRKTVQLTVDPDFISRPFTIAFSSAEVNASQELDLRRYFSPAPVLLFMSETARCRRSP